MKKALVLTGDGINCERETAKAFQDVGAKADTVHVNSLLKNPKMLLDYNIFCLPGGFSFGDELKSGKILAEKMRETLMEVFSEFTRKDGLTIGICNGFQILIQLGVFEKTLGDIDRQATLSTNDHGTFLNRWVNCTITDEAARSPWFKGMAGTLMLPMRHKEGRIQVKDGYKAIIPLRYTENVNGAYNQGAALLDPTGQIFGIMPHPEAATQDFLNPLDVTPVEKSANAKRVSQFFKNAVGS